MIGKIFVDMDGVLADFDAGYEAAFGIKPSIATDNVDWQMVRDRKNFYRDLPPMSDFAELWAHIEPLYPTVLTGVPWSVEEAPFNKRQWAEKNLGSGIQVVTCLSKEKYLYCREGDILIDDWEKYRHLWIGAGGRWITHRSAASTIEELRIIGLDK